MLAFRNTYCRLSINFTSVFYSWTKTTNKKRNTLPTSWCHLCSLYMKLSLKVYKCIFCSTGGPLTCHHMLSSCNQCFHLISLMLFFFFLSKHLTWRKKKEERSYSNVYIYRFKNLSEKSGINISYFLHWLIAWQDVVTGCGKFSLCEKVRRFCFQVFIAGT